MRSRSRSRLPGYAVDVIGFPMSAGGILASLDFDFQNGRYYQSGTASVDPTVLTTTSRASTGYADNLAGTWTSFSNNVPRITNKGLLVEEARTNSIRNNSMQGAVAGSPGTLPTNWIVSSLRGLTQQIVAVGSENGVDYIDYRLSGSPTSTGGIFLQFDATTQVPASNGQSWFSSIFMKLAAGSIANFSSLRWAISERDSGGIQLGTSNNTFTSTLSSTLSRFEIGRTNNNAATAYELPFLTFNVTSGLAVDLTLRIGWPQLELGAFATSPIRTTAATVTRAADVVTVTTPPAFGSAYTLFSRATPNAPTTYATNQVALGVNDGTANERSRIRRVAATGIGQGVVTDGGVDTVVASGVVVAQAVSRKIAFAIATLDQALSQNGGAVVLGASTLPATPTIITIGTDQSTTLVYNGYIERAALWVTTRLPNVALQRITT